jgi:hypothetical protein
MEIWPIDGFVNENGEWKMENGKCGRWFIGCKDYWLFPPEL